jgi:hypothetical protein
VDRTRCKTHQDLHLNRTKDPGKGEVCGHRMASGGYSLCHACSKSQGRCMICNELIVGGAEPPAAPKPQATSS